MQFLTLLLFIVLTYANEQDRQIVSKLNPGCERCNPARRPLIYIRAEGPKDTIHQLWDFTDHIPAVIFAIGSPNSTINISWTNIHPDKFEFSTRPWYSFAAAIDSIIEYNDLEDNGHFDSKCVNKMWSLDHLSWRLTDSVLSDKEAMVKLQGEEGGRDGTLEIKLDLLPYKDYAMDLPHLIHTANSTLIDVRLVNQTEYHKFNSSRFALHFVLVSSDDRTDSWSMGMLKSLDDEHTPGVFEIIEVKSPRTIRSGDGGFLQFRPVAYTEPQRDVSSSTNAYMSNFNRTALPRRSILDKFYSEYRGPAGGAGGGGPAGGAGAVALTVQETVVSFGLAGDGFYKQHNFTAWSFTIGYGSPPLEGFSLFVVVIISACVGVAALLALSGVLYLLLRRYKRRIPLSRFTNDQ